MNVFRASYPAPYLRMPYVERGMKVGLFGGSFNPPHAGHVLVSEIALRRLGLDQIWWMVSPGNPLKDHSDLEALDARVTASNAMVEDPRVKITAFEAVYGLRYTAETLRFLKRYNPGIHFVWVMSADNLASFHHWQDWRGIAQTFPIAVIDRPGSTLSYLSAPMAKVFSRHRMDESDARQLPTARAPAWTFIHGPRSTLSSTAIRKARVKSA